MPFIDPDPHSQLGSVVGNGHCVALVQQGAQVPHTSRWRRGDAVVGKADLQPGTAIATFNDQGRYANALDGSSHAAIFMGHEDHGIRVVDQWKGHPTSPRIIGNRKGTGPAVDDASRFHVIEVADV